MKLVSNSWTAVSGEQLRLVYDLGSLQSVPQLSGFGGIRQVAIATDGVDAIIRVDATQLTAFAQRPERYPGTWGKSSQP